MHLINRSVSKYALFRLCVADKEPQELTVYEFNEQDRNSPLLLPFNKPGFDTQRLRPVAGLGMIVAFTNKVLTKKNEKKKKNK